MIKGNPDIRMLLAQIKDRGKQGTDLLNPPANPNFCPGLATHKIGRREMIGVNVRLKNPSHLPLLICRSRQHHLNEVMLNGAGGRLKIQNRID